MEDPRIEQALRLAETTRQAEIARQAEEAARQTEATRYAEGTGQPAEASRPGDAARRPDAARHTDEVTRQADVTRQAAIAARQAEADRDAATARQAGTAQARPGAATAPRQGQIKTPGSAQPISAVPAAARPGPNPAANAAPIGRLVTSGPDAPRKYADQELGPTWFGGKTESDKQESESKAGAGPETGTKPEAQLGEEPNAAADGVVIDLDITGLVSGLVGAATVVAPDEAVEGQLPARHQAPEQSDAEEVQPGEVQPGEDPPVEQETDQALLVPGPEPTEVKPAGPPRPEPLGPEDLAAIRWRLDGATLREVVDDRDALRELGERLDGPLAEEQDNVARAGLLSVRAEVYRLLGELGMAAAASRLALVHAESAGDVQAIVIAQAELAHVLRLRGDYAEADRLFEEAASSEAPEILRSVVHENAGRSCFDQGRHMEALDHFARAVRLGLPDDQELVQRIDVALESVYIHVLRDGWGPYPRLRREILGRVKAADPEQS